MLQSQVIHVILLPALLTGLPHLPIVAALSPAPDPSSRPWGHGCYRCGRAQSILFCCQDSSMASTPASGVMFPAAMSAETSLKTRPVSGPSN